MTAYMVGELELIDATKWRAFIDAAAPIVPAYGGKFLSVRGKVTPAVGNGPNGATLVMFDSAEKAHEYLNSAEYKTIIPLRDAGAKCRVYVLDASEAAHV